MNHKYLSLSALVLWSVIAKAQEKAPVAPPAPDSAGATKPKVAAEIKLTEEEKKIILAHREEEIDLPASKTSEFAATVLNTNFVVPILRFNTVKEGAATSNQKGNVSFFNSVGAGVSINWGRLELTTDENSKVINREMHNTFGLQVGLLFAANTGSQNNANIFAPTFSLSLLNFQVGVGYELGTLPTTENRGFYTLAYAIPIAKLVKGGFYVLKRTPLPLNTKSGFN